MNERIIELVDIAPKEFWGTQDAHLEIIKKYYPKLKIVARGNTLKVFGEKEELDEFETRFKRLTTLSAGRAECRFHGASECRKCT